MKKSKPLIVCLAALVLVGGMLINVPVTPARADTSAQLMTLDSSSLPVTLVSQSVISGQDVVTNWTDASGDTFTVAGPAGTVLTIGTVSETEPAGIATTTYIEVSPPVISTTDITGDQAIAQYEASGLSLYQDALAVGFSTTEAQQMADEEAGKGISQTCWSHKWKGIAQSHQCDDQILLQHNGSKDWYIANKIVASAAPIYGNAALESYRVYATYAHHTRTDWAPEGILTHGGCSNANLSVSTPGGVTLGYSRDFCPQTLNPFFPTIAGFGARWEDTNGVCASSSTESGPYQGDPSASVEYDAGGAPTDNYSVWARVWYYPKGCIHTEPL